MRRFLKAGEGDATAGRGRRAKRLVAAALFMVMAVPADAAPAVHCGGAALLSGAELLCSHTDPRKPAQLCTFSWALATVSNQTQIVQGSFLLPPGSSNVQVYAGAGFSHAMSQPIVMCQGKRGKS